MYQQPNHQKKLLFSPRHLVVADVSNYGCYRIAPPILMYVNKEAIYYYCKNMLTFNILLIF